MKTTCCCGGKATMNLRIDESGIEVASGETIEISGNDRYAALCGKHFFEAFGE